MTCPQRRPEGTKPEQNPYHDITKQPGSRDHTTGNTALETSRKAHVAKAIRTVITPGQEPNFQ